MVPLLTALALCYVPVSWAVVTISFDGEFSSCQRGMDLISVDMTKFDILMLDNENFTLDGRLVFKKDFNNPVGLNIKLERKNRAMWIPVTTRLIPNFCDVILHPNDFWTTVVAAFEKQRCPFPAGHVETFDNTNIGNMARQMMLPPSMLGDWRMFVELRTMRDGKLETECTQAVFLLEEV
ncbi:uncharacterized protein LOC109419732 isoform X2 [Aedes albopictus]|uniref:Secreted protein n=1 Tax=Aedes albopictus TaxID=7160 RepID=A0ABM1ZZA8_AEDAL|nr:uncharacterized protein LOC109419732 [Aedes albopictus]